MKNLYLIGNWKMNPTSLKEAEQLSAKVVAGVKKIKPQRVEVVLCPPFSYTESVGRKTKSGAVKLGAQNCHYETSGAYTGEISPKMLKDLGCTYVIVGHSERRHKFGEDSELINKKISAVFSNKMTPVLAVGEKEGESVNVVTRQIKEALAGVSSARIKQMILAYEPVWAIGSGKAADPNDAMSARLLIQKALSDMYSRKTAEDVPILYGGSTNSKNLIPFITEAGMSGALVGGASLKGEEFVKMIEKL